MQKLLIPTKGIIALTCALGLFATSVAAQESQPKDNALQTYPKTYFDQFTAQTARDMIDRLPGFILDTGSNVRGFGAGAGNVLINGSRPSSKTGGIEEALERIGSSSVERIDIIRGSSGSSETAGQSVVANIITRQGGTSGRWEFQIERAAHGKINTATEFTLEQSFSGWETSSKINAHIERRPLDATRTTRDALGVINSIEQEKRPSKSFQIAASTEAKRAAAGGLLVVNGRLNYNPVSFKTDRFGFDSGVIGANPDQRRSIDFERKFTQAEIGVDWTRSLANDWSLKLLSLSALDNTNQQSLVFSERPVGTQTSNSVFDSRKKSFETVARATMSKVGTQNIIPKFGGEIAYNRLNSDLALRLEDANGITEIILPAANVLVEELRGEAFANLTWKASKNMIVETGLSVELSEISVSGDAENTRSFVFAKPFASLVYDISPGVQIRFDGRQSVGQLNFSDFAASASASNDRVTAGNPELGPDQTTRVSTALDLRSKSGSALNVEVYHEWRNDILEQIILPSGAQGLGNAGNAQVWGLRSTASFPLSFIIPGGLVELEAEFSDSSFFDPVISGKRAVSNIDDVNISIDFRQDIPNWKMAWGVSYTAPLEGPFFFVDEISLNGDGRTWGAFIETTRFLGVKTHLEFAGIGDRKFFNERSFYNPDRGGIFTGSLTSASNRGLFATLTISNQF